MTESRSHKSAKRKAAGKGGRTEVRLKGGRRLDAKTKSGNTATEVERSGSNSALEKAAGRLKKSGSIRKVLQVPQPDMAKAAAAMRKVGTKGSVKNLSGTKRRSV